MEVSYLGPDRSLARRGVDMVQGASAAEQGRIESGLAHCDSIRSGVDFFGMDHPLGLVAAEAENAVPYSKHQERHQSAPLIVRCGDSPEAHLAGDFEVVQQIDQRVALQFAFYCCFAGPQAVQFLIAEKVPHGGLEKQVDHMVGALVGIPAVDWSTRGRCVGMIPADYPPESEILVQISPERVLDIDAYHEDPCNVVAARVVDEEIHCDGIAAVRSFAGAFAAQRLTCDSCRPTYASRPGLSPCH